MIVVTGATGNVGRELARLLAESGEQVTAVSRHQAELPEGVRHHSADLAQSGNLAPAFAGAEALFLLTPGGPIDLPAVLDAAVAGDIKRIVLLSSQRIATRPQNGLSGHEDAVAASGLEWTVLRPGGFASNALLWAESVRTRRMIAAPFADVGLPVIDPADIAAVAAAILREPGHHERAYELTGPAVITPRQQAHAIADALAEPVEFVEQTRAEARTELSRHWPEPIVDGTLDTLGEPNPAELRISPDVERILGRAPGGFADWARRHVTAFK